MLVLGFCCSSLPSSLFSLASPLRMVSDASALDWLGKVKGMGNGMDSLDLASCEKVATTGSSWVKGVGKQERWQERRWQWCEQEVLMNQLRAALSQLDQLWQALEPEPSLAKPSQH